MSSSSPLTGLFHASDTISNQVFALPSLCQLSNTAGSTKHDNSVKVKNLEGGCKERAKYAASYAFFLNELCEMASLYSGMENK